MQITYLGFNITIPDKYATPNMLQRFKKKVYEMDEINFLKRYVKSSDVPLELGACLGVTSVMTNKLLNKNNKKKHVVIEANKDLIQCLQKTKKNNNCEFNVKYCVISEKPLKFFIYDKVVAGSAHRQDDKESGKKEIVVKNISLNDKQFTDKFNLLIMDIEGGELDFLQTYQKYISQYINTIIIELHGHLMNDELFNTKCIIKIVECGLVLVEKKGHVYVFLRPLSILQ